jgi:hypothetical protein
MISLSVAGGETGLDMFCTGLPTAADPARQRSSACSMANMAAAARVDAPILV